MSRRSQPSAESRSAENEYSADRRSARPSPRRRPTSRHERLTIIYGILCIVLILVVLQLWLLTATMNAYLGGDQGVIWPAAIASVVCLMLNLGLLWNLYRLEH